MLIKFILGTKIVIAQNFWFCLTVAPPPPPLPLACALVSRNDLSPFCVTSFTNVPMHASRLLMTCMQSGSGMVIASWLTNQLMQDVSKKKSILRLVPLPPFWLAVFPSLMLWWESTPSWYVCKFLILIRHCWFFHTVKGGNLNSSFSISSFSSLRLVIPNGRLRLLCTNC